MRCRQALNATHLSNLRAVLLDNIGAVSQVALSSILCLSSLLQINHCLLISRPSNIRY